MNFQNWINDLFKRSPNPKPDTSAAAVSHPFINGEAHRPVRPILDVIKDLSREVHDSVLLEHISVPSQEQLKAWIELGVSIVRNHWRGPFSPAKNARDAELQKDLQITEAAVIEARNNEGRTRNNKRQSLMAAPGKKETRPPLPIPIIVTGIGGFTTLFTFTFVELPMLMAIDDTLARVLCAAIPGFVLASMVVFSAFQIGSKNDTATVIFSKAGLREMTWKTASGLGLIAGMGLLRFTLTSGWREQLFCVSLAIVEGALWGYMRTAAARNSELQDEYDRRHEADAARERDAELCGQFHREDEQSLAEALAAEAVVKQRLAWRLEGDFDLEATLRFVAAEIQNSYLNAIGHIKGQTVIGNVHKDFDFRSRQEPGRSYTGNVH